jgi:hypothetical protein
VHRRLHLHSPSWAKDQGARKPVLVRCSAGSCYKSTLRLLPKLIGLYCRQDLLTVGLKVALSIVLAVEGGPRG